MTEKTEKTEKTGTKKMYFVNLVKTNEDIEFHVTEGVVTTVSEDVIEGYIVDRRMNNGKQDWKIPTTKLDKVFLKPFGKDVENLKFFGYSLEEENLYDLEMMMVDEMESEIKKFHKKAKQAKKNVQEFKKEILKHRLL